MENQNMSLIAGVTSVLLAIVLIVSVFISKTNRLEQGKDGIDIEPTFDSSEVIVEDTTAPEVVLKERYIFTNDIAKLEDFTSMIEKVSDKWKYTFKLVRFEKVGVLQVMNDLALRNLTKTADNFAKKEEALKVGSEQIPTDAGIYRSVMEIADTYGNVSYEEVYVILDTTGAMIDDVEDQVVYVSKDKLTAQPDLDLSLYKAVDNVDGYLTSDDFTFEVSVRDEAKHEWIVKVSYTDRAGNESSGEFLMTVVEGTTSTSKPENITTYKPADTNKDGVVDTDEQMKYITQEKQACIDAGYGVVCEFDGGEWYGVLMKNSDHTIDGKHGWEILEDYLKGRELEATDIGGCYIDSEKEWYWYTAKGIRELITEEDEGFWS